MTAHAFCSSARLKFARDLRAKRAGPKEREFNSGQVSSEICERVIYWLFRGVNGPLPFFPFGNLLSRAFKPPDVYEMHNLKKYGKVYGSYNGLQPTLTIIEPSLIKQVLVKNFNHFADRRVLNTCNPVFDNNLFLARKTDWQRSRSVLSPTFSSVKIKSMWSTIDFCVKQLKCCLETKTSKLTKNSSNNISLIVDVKKICAGFFIDIVLSSIIFELAHNEKIQKKLYNEMSLIELQFKIKNNKKNNYNFFEQIINSAPYLSAVIDEGIRKYSPFRLERLVTADKVCLGGISLDKEILIEIPTYAVHHCPDYYPNPEQFKPERFLPENKHLLIPYTYLGFGKGPKNCLGMKFALQTLKLCLGQMAHIAISAAAALDKAVRSRCRSRCYRCRHSRPGLSGEHSCCGGSSAQLRAARSDVTWPLSTTDDEAQILSCVFSQQDSMNGTRRRGLAPLGHCKLPLPRVLRAERARPEAAEVYSSQAMSGEPPLCIPQQCTAQNGEVWHLLATLNFRCLGFCERSEPTYKHFLTQKYAAKSIFDIDSAVNNDNKISNNNSSVALHLQSFPATTTTSTFAVTQQHLTLASPTAQQQQ
ncbi:hypothetical protein TYRP_022611 [Tyrophagus putrescentiae]|nr:hypothetical protein TYRP_022611 [Tyrophagus putrescentiae]